MQIDHDFIVSLAEGYVQQMEQLVRSRKRDLALRLQGGIAACIDILERDAKEWSKRMEKALTTVDIEVVAAPQMPDELPVEQKNG